MRAVAEEQGVADWASLLGDLSRPPITGRPEDDKVEWRVHDRTHVEFAIDYPASELSSDYRWEAYFFVPASFRLDEATYDKKELYDDLQSYVRLAVPELPFSGLADGGPTAPLARLKAALGEAVGVPEGSAAVAEAGRQLRLFACYVRATGLSSLREVERAAEAKLPGGAELRSMAAEFGQSCARAARALRAVIDEALGRGLSPELATIARWADEDVSLVLETFCASLAVMLERRADEDPRLRGLAEHVAALAVGEARHRAARGYDSVVAGDGDGRQFEHLEFRRHVLKRFTSSTLWLSLERREGPQWVLHALYALAAAVAMTFALVASIQTNPFSQQVFRYAILVAVAYAAKDRIKAFLQNSVTKWLAKRFPDRLWTIRDVERGRDLGEITERAGFLAFRRVPGEVLQMRRLTREHALEEQARPERVLWYKKAVSLRPGAGLPGPFPAVTEIFRLNVRQWLEHTDDRNRKFLFADPRDARIYSATARRVYNINVVYRLTHGAENAVWHRIRVVVSRKGIERIDAIC
ncbi:MAG: hypothetical protein MUF34_33910 [Polyangiaceae bacterium]|nr:hypothetical protein [Polyangiaceae bacterium]